MRAILWGAGLLGALAVMHGVTLWRAAAREAAAEAAFPPQGQFVEVSGTRVHYLEKGAGPPVVLIHGASGNLRDPSFSLLDRLAQDYRVIAFDRPGLGYTDRLNDTGESLADQARLLSDACAELGVERPIVLGQSYGGAVALAWALERPDAVSALVLVAAPALPWDSPLPLLYKVNAHPVLGPLFIPYLSAWVPESYLQATLRSIFAPNEEPPGYAEYIGAPLTLRRSSLKANAQHRSILLPQIREMAPRYAADLTLPIELIHGDADTTVGLEIHSRPLSERLENAHLTVLEGVGHMPHHARMGAVVEAVHRARDRAAKG